MYKFNRVLVGLDNTEIDKDLIQAASDLCVLSGTKEVFFINVIKEFDLPESLKKEFPDLVIRAIEERKNELQTSVNKYFKYEEAKVAVNVLVEQGSVTKTVLKISAKEKIDLIVLGRKNEKKAGVLLTRIARRALCSLLILPKGQTIKFKKIFVPTDFSNYSKSAMEKALTLARRSEGESKITVQHVYQVPSGYHYAGKTFREFALIMKENSEKEYARFMSNFDPKNLDILSVFSLDNDDHITDVIVKEAKKRHADIIIIGAKGRTAAAALFIGSKTERLVQLNEEIPMLVIRPKGKSVGLMEYLKDL
ncbi:MAG: nucleotide-binding universal stress UspA family protein [Cyclobacteriaceae bacterium]|jgi:nucleotide-binding universal stress UspA family protein